LIIWFTFLGHPVYYNWRQQVSEQSLTTMPHPTHLRRRSRQPITRLRLTTKNKAGKLNTAVKEERFLRFDRKVR